MILRKTKQKTKPCVIVKMENRTRCFYIFYFIYLFIFSLFFSIFFFGFVCNAVIKCQNLTTGRYGLSMNSIENTIPLSKSSFNLSFSIGILCTIICAFETNKLMSNWKEAMVWWSSYDEHVSHHSHDGMLSSRLHPVSALIIPAQDIHQS